MQHCPAPAGPVNDRVGVTLAPSYSINLGERAATGTSKQMIHGVRAELVIPSGKTHCLGNPLELGGIVKYSSLAQLPDLSSEDLLPWCLTWGVFEWTHFLLSLFNLLWRELDIGDPLLEIDANDISVLEITKHTASCGFGRGIEDGR